VGEQQCSAFLSCTAHPFPLPPPILILTHMPNHPPNTLYYGDNLEILRRYIEDESIDLIHLDPPFNSNADYNVLFAEKDGTQAHAQIKAFEDIWSWDLESAAEYAETLRSGHDRLAKCLKGLHDFLGPSDMLAYLSMMALRFRNRYTLPDEANAHGCATPKRRRRFCCPGVNPRRAVALRDH